MRAILTQWVLAGKHWTQSRHKPFSLQSSLVLCCGCCALTSSLNRPPRVCIISRLLQLFRMSLSKHQPPDFPELCVLAIISQMSLVDRISARQVCPEWYHRVKETNQTTVQSLAITVKNEDEVVNFEHLINYSKGVLRSARLLTNSDRSPQFPMHRLNKWNCFQLSDDDQQNLGTLKQITFTFPSITKLIFVTTLGKKLKLLTEVLQTDHWQHQLISLKMICRRFSYGFDDPTILQPLFTAINSLPAFKYLTLSGVELYDLPILAQLKKTSVALCSCDSILNSLKKYSTENTGELSVDALGGAEPEFSKLSDHLRSSITFLNFSKADISNLVFFPNLTSLSLYFSPSEHGHLFTALSQLHQLLQLKLEVNFLNRDPEHQFSPPQAQLLSVKALDLLLLLNSHSEVHLLNLPETMPNLQAIHLSGNYCKSCKTKCSQTELTDNNFNRNCPRDVLQVLHHSTGLPLNRLSYYYNENVYTLSGELI